MSRLFLTSFLLFITQLLFAQTDSLLVGTPIGTNSASAANAFDGNFGTYYKASTASYGWVGLDLGTLPDGQDRRCVITRLGWVSRVGNYATLGLIEGANTPDFSDAVPLYLIPESGSGTEWNDVEVPVSRAFRYLRYVSPLNQYCRITDLRFFGYESEGSDSLFYQPTNLPVISIHTHSGKEPQDKVTEIPATISVSHRDGTKHFDMECTVRYRGNGSYQFPKKGYRIKLAEKHKMAGSPAKAKKWTLIPSYGDKTLMRNILAFDVSRRMEMAYTPFCQPVDVFVNGEYKGNFELCDQLTVDKQRVNITEIKADEPIDDETLSGGYLFEIDANYNSSQGDVGFHSARAGKSINVKSPDKDAFSLQHKSWLRRYFDDMESFIYQRNYEAYSRYLDIESFLRYFLINEYCSNTDTFWEMYLYKDRNDSLIHSGPVWDVDLGFDNDNRTHQCLWNSYWLYSMDTYYNWQWQGSSCYSDMRTVVGYILQNQHVKQRLAEIWAYYRASGAMHAAQLEAVLEETRELLYASQHLNFKRWNILNQQVHQNYQALGSYDNEVDYVKAFLSKRISWMDHRAGINATTLTLTLPESRWTTLFVPTAFTVPEGLTLYQVTPGTEAEQPLGLLAVSVAQANRPYLLYGEPGTYTLLRNDELSFDTPATDGDTLGLLTGSRYATNAPLGSYYLQTNADGQIGFQRVTTNNVSLTAKSAYLTLTDAASFPSFIPLSESLSIEGLTPDAPFDAQLRIYSLSGALLLTLPDAALTPADLRQYLSPGLYLLQTSDTSDPKKIWVE